MKKLVSLLFIVVCFVGLGSLYWQNHQTEAQIAALRQTLHAVQTEHTQLSDSLTNAVKSAPATKEQSAEVEATRRSIEKEVEAIHLLKFKKPIVYRTMKSSDFGAFIKTKMKEVYTDEEMKNYSNAMALMGLVPEGTDISKVILGLYGEQVAAFYEQHKGELYTFSDFSFSENIDRMMLSHEMTHALQDQNFELKKFPLEIKTNDDLTLATAALVEGDATMLMMLWYVQHMTENMNILSLLKDLGSMFVQNTEQLAAAPAYFRETLLFPYQQGNEFVTELYNEGGYAAINKAFEKPPVSTEQILHPSKYWPKREDPIEMKLPELKIDGWKPVFVNVLGEMGTRILLQQNVTLYEASRAAAGWGGDRYEVFEDRKGKLTMLWMTVWDTESDAREFQEAVDAAEHKRTGMTNVKHAADANGFTQYGSDKFYVAIRKAGAQVTVILGTKENVTKLISVLPKN